MKKFTDIHLPKVPNFLEENLPKMAPWPPKPDGALGPKELPRSPTLIDAYFRGDLRVLRLDALSRPDHYTPRQKELLELLDQKKPLPVDLGPAELNDLVFRYMERSEQKKQRREIVSRASKKIEEQDPSIKRLLERENEKAAPTPEAAATYENQDFLKAVKII